MKVLVVNCGSSSLKYQVIDSDTEQVEAKGLCERIGLDGRLVYQPTGGEKEVTDAPMPTHNEAIQMVLDALVNPKTGVLKSLDEVEAIGHRVLHGGAKLTESALVNDGVISAIEEEQKRETPLDIAVGDTVKVSAKIREGEKERIQVFEGVVLKIQGTGARKTFTVRKFSNGVGVEKTWPVNSPNVAKVEVVRHGKIRRARLNYLRDRIGKRAKVKEKI